MKLTTYLAFTLISIILQFAVMGVIQSSQKLGNKTIDLNITSPKKHRRDVLEDLSKPHALFYSTNMNAVINKDDVGTKLYSNSTVPDIRFKTPTTNAPSTTVDVFFYEENASTTTIEDIFTSTEAPSTTELDYDNATEIILFEKKNTSQVKPNATPRNLTMQDCQCNLLYEVCDISCCCDIDCSETQLKLFSCFSESKRKPEVFCDSHSLSSYLEESGGDNLFCIAKTNLPDRRIVSHNKHDPSTVSKALKWHAQNIDKPAQIFEKQMYKYGDPIWVLRNGSVYYMDLPTKVMNNYCSDRKAIQFLKNERIKCNVKLADFEILQIFSTSDHESVISVTEKSLNSSALNCTTLHCANWTTLVCNETACVNYNQTVHEPVCNETICSHLALKVDYLFYYYDSKITNVTIKLYTHDLYLNVAFFQQDINVNFLLANVSYDDIISLSGNPGYITGLPILVSYSEDNYTDGFYDKSLKRKHLPYPENVKGICATPVEKFVLFGVNQQMKCRYTHIHSSASNNATSLCRNIQSKIKLLLGLKDKVMICPLGNPRNIKDPEWLKLSAMDESPVFGEFNQQKTQLICYNFMVRVSYVFTYADASEVEGKRENRILSAKLAATERNVTFKMDDITVVMTIDTIFIDESGPIVYEYAAAPQLHIHLPKDFFFPFNNNSSIFRCNVFVIMFVFLLVTYRQIK